MFDYCLSNIKLSVSFHPKPHSGGENVFYFTTTISNDRDQLLVHCRLLSNAVTWQLGGGGHCVPICIQLQLALTHSLHNKQSVLQIKIMAITDGGLHILSAAKVRTESMNAPGWKAAEAPLSLFLSLFPLPPSSLRIYQALISSVSVWVTALSRRVLMKWLGILLCQPAPK